MLINVYDLRPFYEDSSSKEEDKATPLQAATPEPKRPGRPRKIRRVVDKRDNAKRAKQAELTSPCADTELCNATDQQTDFNCQRE